MHECYLDNSATTRVSSKAAEAMLRIMTEQYGNPSSLHGKGAEAQLELEKARKIISKLLSVDKSEIYFTSGGTEANNLAVFGAAYALKRRGNRIVTTAVEHPSVYDAAKQLEQDGFEVIFLKPDKYGRITPEQCREAINKDTILVSMMLVNNELGTILPVKEAVKAVKQSGASALVHCDAVQAFGKLPVKPSTLGVDLMSISSHKVHGPKGAGALYLKKGTHIIPRSFGGLQESSIRCGTEALPAIVGFAAAAEETDSREKVEKLNLQLRDRISELDFVYINSPEDALPYIISIAVPPIKSETMLHFLSSKGIYVSSGSACSKGKKSRILTECGIEDRLADSTIRVSFSRENTPEDVDILVNALCEAKESLVGRG